MGIDWSEFQRGLARTWPHLLSHHLPSERHRCYAPVVFGRRIYVCARCLGIYPGIIAVFSAALLKGGAMGHPLASLPVVLLFPLPTLVDWSLTTFIDRRGYNTIRTATGFLLGFGYASGLVRLLLADDLRVIAVGIGYGVAAGVLLSVSLTDR